MSRSRTIFFTAAENEMKTVVVIGAGASGMAAAITAAEDMNNRVILLERQQRVGKKLLSTGNGRCNLTNTGASIGNYHGSQPDFASAVLEKFTPEDTLRFFDSLGLVTSCEYGGRAYPQSNSANSVVDVLRFALLKDNISVKTSCPARSIKRSGEGFAVQTDGESIYADYLIVSCGGAAGAKVGGVGDGYELLKPLGHKCTKIMPSLVQLITDPTYPRALKGVRVNARLALERDGETLAKSEGELQFTETGLSGPAAFDISRAAAVSGEGIVHIDLTGGADVAEKLRARAEANPQLGAEDILTGVLHNRLGRMVVKYAGVSGAKRIGELSGGELESVARACRDFAVRLRGVEDFDHAQVTAGGIKTTGVNPQTLESWFVPHLFITGELLDVDGDCGGYNLQWAWASGVVAGRLGK